MTSDLRFLIFLNFLLVAICAYAAFGLIRSNSGTPDWFGPEGIEKKIADADEEKLRELAAILAAGLENRIAAVNSDRRRIGILLGFTALVAGYNLWLLFFLYQKSRRGLYLRDGVMIESA